MTMKTTIKTFWHAMAMVMLLAMSVAVASCGNADDGMETEATYPMELLGIWDGMDRQVTVTDADGQTEDFPVTDINNYRIAVNANGTLVTYERSAGSDWREISRAFWLYNENRLLVTDKDGDRLYVVRELKGDRLVLSGSQKQYDSDGVATGGVVTTTDTFRRAM